jgi:hypothetical protein
MRDSTMLRHRLAMLACLPALAVTIGCQDPPSTTASASESKKSGATRDGKRGAADRSTKAADADDKRSAAKARRLPDGEKTGAKAEENGPPDVEGDGVPAVEAKASHVGPNHAGGTETAVPQAPVDPRYMPIPGDPPYVDGYNPEEETCPSGNWCGTIASAAAILPKGDTTPPVMECAARIVGAHEPSPIEGKTYEGLSAKKTMQGAFNEGRTKARRAKGDEDACCYHWFEYCSGRPLLDGAEGVIAPARSSNAWLADDVEPSIEGLTDRARRALAAAWLEDALREHASIAAFSRATIELLAIGAPPELVEACQHATLDEIDHARRCFSLATAYAGRPLGPGPLPGLAPRGKDIVGLALDTFVEGCVGETIAALVAERAGERTRDPAVRATLRVIAEDEARHAALAWRTIAWAVQAGGAPVETALRRLLERPPTIDPVEPMDAATRAALGRAWADHGRLDDVALAQTVSDAWQDIITPMLRGLVQQDDARTSARTPSA